MKVKSIHFIKSCPGLPLYELESGKLLMPFSKRDGKNVNWFWVSADELIIPGMSPQEVYKRQEPFIKAEQEIKKDKLHSVK